MVGIKVSTFSCFSSMIRICYPKLKSNIIFPSKVVYNCNSILNLLIKFQSFCIITRKKESN